MDVTTVLREQHAQLRRALLRAARPGPRRAGELRRLVRMLAQHEAAEQAHVHPAARRLAGPAVTSARGGEEERVMRLLDRLRRTGPDGPGYLRCLGVLSLEVLRHAAREEREEFRALDRLSRARRWMLAAEVRLARLVAPTRPHPKVSGQLATKLTTPVLGPADRLRDLALLVTARRSPGARAPRGWMSRRPPSPRARCHAGHLLLRWMSRRPRSAWLAIRPGYRDDRPGHAMTC
jgi:hypothetical protein